MVLADVFVLSGLCVVAPIGPDRIEVVTSAVSVMAGELKYIKILPAVMGGGCSSSVLPAEGTSVQGALLAAAVAPSERPRLVSAVELVPSEVLLAVSPVARRAVGPWYIPVASKGSGADE